MEEDAVTRTPVEIWRLILLKASYWDPVPQTSDPIHKRALFFFSRCTRYHSYQRAAGNQGRLRLVCRAWNTIIKGLPHDLSIVDTHGIVWPSPDSIIDASCVVVLSTVSCFHCLAPNTNGISGYLGSLPIPYLMAKRFYKQCWTKEIQAEWYQKEIKPRLDRSTRNVISIVDSEDLDSLLSMPIDDLINRSTTPHAVCSTATEKTMHLMATNPQCWHHLTHLRLRFIYNFNWRQGKELEFPILSHLEINIILPDDVYPDWAVATSSTSFFSWVTPKLQILRLDGELTPQIRVDIDKFIFKNANTIIALIGSCHIIEEDYQETDWRLSFSAWNKLSRLSTLRLDLKWFGERDTPKPSPDANHIEPLTFIVAGFRDGLDDQFEETREWMVELLSYCKSLRCGVKQIIVEEPWFRISATVSDRGREDIKSVMHLIEAFLEHGIEFRDGDGVEIREDAVGPARAGLEAGVFPVNTFWRDMTEARRRGTTGNVQESGLYL